MFLLRFVRKSFYFLNPYSMFFYCSQKYEIPNAVYATGYQKPATPYAILNGIPQKVRKLAACHIVQSDQGPTVTEIEDNSTDPNVQESWMDSILNECAVKVMQGFSRIHSQRISALEDSLRLSTEGWKQSLVEISTLLDEKDALIASLASEKRILNDLQAQWTLASNGMVSQDDVGEPLPKVARYTVPTEPITPTSEGYADAIIPLNFRYQGSPV